MSAALEPLIDWLSARQPDCSAEDIADMLWLARYLPRGLTPRPSLAGAHARPMARQEKFFVLSIPSIPGKESRTAEVLLRPGEQAPATPTTRSPGATKSAGAAASYEAGRPVRLPAAPGLEQARRFAASLRPLRRMRPSLTEQIIDPEQTARRIADEKIWLPVLRPRPQGALSLALVIDQGRSMGLWQALLRDLRRWLVERAGFRHSRVWSLLTDEVPARLVVGEQAQREGMFRDPRELIEPAGQWVVIVSDCISAAWYRQEDGVLSMLEVWGQHAHLVLFNPLGEYLWPRTRLGLATPVNLSASQAAASSRALRVKNELFGWPLPGVRLPVVEIEPTQVARWARMAMALGGTVAPGYVLGGDDVDATEVPSPAVPDSRTPAQVLDAFWRVASPQARYLLSLLAATVERTGVINLPLLRLVRAAFIPECRASHEAEVLYSGLFRPLHGAQTEGLDAAQWRYELPSEVRRQLQGGLPAYEVERLWAYIERNRPQGESLFGLLTPLEPREQAAEKRVEPSLPISAERAGRIWPEQVKAPELEVEEALQRLDEAICHEGLPVTLSPETLRQVISHNPRNLREYRLGRVAEWSQPAHAVDKHFVQPTLLIEPGDDAPRPRWEQRQQFQDLREVLQAVDLPALVLLGAPGSGKSTLLRRLDLDQAVETLCTAQEDDGPNADAITCLISLNLYGPARPGDPLPLPGQWLVAHWAAQYPALPALDTLLHSGRLTLLLDGLNEMPHADEAEYRQRIGLWRDYLAELAHTHPGNRIVFSCRSLDYSAPLSTSTLPVPQVNIEALSDDQVQAFLKAYTDHWERIWESLGGTPQLNLLRLPYFLRVLVEQVEVQGEVPHGRAGLLTALVRQALRREVERKDNALFLRGGLLDELDSRLVVAGRGWKTSFELPSHGPLFPKLSVLAYRMQELRSAAEAAPVRIAYQDALDILDDARAEAILQAGVALGVLERDLGRDEVLYMHQLLQEYFAARKLAAQPALDVTYTAWRADELTPSLEETLAHIGDADPLPPAPVTGWEETTVLAAAMAADPDTFVAELMETNLPLAGRCTAQAEVTVSESLKDPIRQALVERTQDRAADLRARIAAGRALGALGDPRFERRTGPQGEYLLPPCVAIPGGSYPLGSAEGLYDDEAPAHTVELEGFRLARFPVTNAEWQWFMEANGYEDERWWQTEAAQAWRRGEGTAEGPKQQWREYRRWLMKNLEQVRNRPDYTSQNIEFVERIINMEDAEFETLLEEWYPPGRQTQPFYWNDEAFNHPAQPVVGICWHEAWAYCAWLSAQSGLDFRLPTEAEWEAAARGKTGRRFAYGDDFDAWRGNTFETHVRGTTPIGVFPGGETPEGLVDMTGNTWDWTSSEYRPYPYDSGDGREAPLSGGDSRRVLRGGSWGNNQVNARAAYRNHSHPGFRDDNLGVRVVRASPISVKR